MLPFRACGPPSGGPQAPLRDIRLEAAMGECSAESADVEPVSHKLLISRFKFVF